MRRWRQIPFCGEPGCHAVLARGCAKHGRLSCKIHLNERAFYKETRNLDISRVKGMLCLNKLIYSQVEISLRLEPK
jgi:hypothetical protein